MMYTYKITIKRWVDGDTLDADVDLGFGVHTGIRFRLLELDTPEKGQDNFKEAKECAEDIYPIGSTLVVTSIKGTDKYVRWLVSLPLVNQAINKARLNKADLK